MLESILSRSDESESTYAGAARHPTTHGASKTASTGVLHRISPLGWVVLVVVIALVVFYVSVRTRRRSNERRYSTLRDASDDEAEHYGTGDDPLFQPFDD